MTIDISALPAAAQATDADELAVDQDGTVRKVTRAQLVSGLATASHGHVLADIADAGALAGHNSIGSSEIESGAVGTGNIADNAITPAKLDRGYAEPGHTHEPATSSADGYMSAADKVKLDGIQAGAEANRALASQTDAEAGTDNVKGMTPLRTAQAITALAGNHSHTIADITDAGDLAARDKVGIADLSIEAQSRLLPDPSDQPDEKIAKVVSGAWVIGEDELGEPGGGEANTGANIGTDGVGVFAGKIGTELRFRHIASLTPALRVTLDDLEGDIDAEVDDVQAGGNSGLMTGADKAKLDGIQAGAEANRVLASQVEAESGTDNDKGMTPLRTAQAITALAGSHSHTIADITDAGHLAALDEAGTDDIADNAVTPAKLDRGYAELDHTHETATSSIGGYMSASDKVKLDGIEAGAAADQSGSEIKALYEAEADTNPFTDAEQTKLDGIEAGAEANPAVVSEAEAVAGTATFERIWTAERVNQAIQALAPDGGGGSAFNFEADASDYSVTAFEVGAGGATQNEERQFTSTAGTNQINFPAGIGADSFGFFSLGSGAAAAIRCPAGVTVNGQDDRGGANSTIAVRGFCQWRRLGADVFLVDGAVEFATDVWGAKTFKQTATFEEAPTVPDASFSIAKTSGLQTALSAKAPLDSPTFTGTVELQTAVPTEEDVAGDYTPVDADRGKLKRYTGAGHTWTINILSSAAEVAVENDGTGAVTLTAGTATLTGASTIPQGKSATLRFFNGGAKCKALVEA